MSESYIGLSEFNNYFWQLSVEVKVLWKMRRVCTRQEVSKIQVGFVVDGFLGLFFDNSEQMGHFCISCPLAGQYSLP